MFVYNQGLLLTDVGLLGALWVGVTAFVGVFMIGVATEGFLYTKVNFVVRVIAGINALMLISADTTSSIIGLALCAAIIVFQRVCARKETPLAA